jgi:Pyruvate/2-oxoacid:ferredoxin oxidoreductase gamma subunit
MAKEAGIERAANIVMLGVFAGFQTFLNKEFLINSIKREFASKAKFVPLNIRAFESGYKLGINANGQKE